MLVIASSLVSSLVLPTPAVQRGIQQRASVVRMAEECKMDQNVLKKFMDLPVDGKVQAEYLWIDAIGEVCAQRQPLSVPLI